MFFSLIICTYNRPDALTNLLKSVVKQSLLPNEIIIVDSSNDLNTEKSIKNISLPDLKYYKVQDRDRGLTKQRNYGIKKAAPASRIICFLDDDIVLEADYFKNLIFTFEANPEAIGAGGWIKEETAWKKNSRTYKPSFGEFTIDGYARKLGLRNVLRKSLGLLSNMQPGYMPSFSHGLSIGFLPPSGKIYNVEYFMGGVSAYRKELFDKIDFSTHFEGYGLYEDMDFCLRASKLGKLYVNTSAQVWHLHDNSGRPDSYKYGKMVIKNGFYVWKIKYPNPDLISRIKHFYIDIVLLVIRFFNGILGDRTALSDARGRFVGLCEIFLNFMRNKDKNQLKR